MGTRFVSGYGVLLLIVESGGVYCMAWVCCLTRFSSEGAHERLGGIICSHFSQRRRLDRHVWHHVRIDGKIFSKSNPHPALIPTHFCSGPLPNSRYPAHMSQSLAPTCRRKSTGQHPDDCAVRSPHRRIAGEQRAFPRWVHRPSAGRDPHLKAGREG